VTSPPKITKSAVNLDVTKIKKGKEAAYFTT
jgi:hypothetical protein